VSSLKLLARALQGEAPDGRRSTTPL
jgi:hypothetical protein